MQKAFKINKTYLLEAFCMSKMFTGIIGKINSLVQQFPSHSKTPDYDYGLIKKQIN